MVSKLNPLTALDILLKGRRQKSDGPRRTRRPHKGTLRMQRRPLQTCHRDRLRCCACGFFILVNISLFINPVLAESSVLFAHGYHVIPTPQQVTLGETDFPMDSRWALVLGPKVLPQDVAVETLKEELKMRFGLTLSTDPPTSGQPVVLLGIHA